MLSRINKFFSIGAHKSNPSYINDKILLSNQIACFSIMLLGIPFTTVTSLEMPEVAFLGIVAIISAASVPLLNSMRFNYLARLIAALHGVVIIGIVNGLIGQVGDKPLVHGMLGELALSILPFVLFHPKEIKSLVGTSLFSFLYISIYQLRIDYLEIDSQITSPEGWLETFAVAISTFQMFIFLGLLIRINHKSEKKQQQLVSDMNAQNDELKKSQEILENSLKSLDEGKRKEQNQLWITEGAAMIGKIVRSNLEGSEMYDKILADTIKYIDANQGAFYIVDEAPEEHEADVMIKQVSCYAYSRKKFTEQVLEPGEGLLGQCYFEKRIMLLTEIPDDYVNITSGMGEATPGCILIIPLMLNEAVAGFIELAAFEVFDDTKIDFLKRINENLASFIINRRVSERTNILLSKSQEQTEMLRAQEEEMRQNFEELQATQEEMERVQAELGNIKEHLQVELSDKLIELEDYKRNIDVLMNSSDDSILYTNEEGIITICNPRVTAMFGYKQEEIIGKSIDLLFNFDQKTIIEHFTKLTKGKSKLYDNFNGKSKMYGFEFPVELKIGKGEEEEGTIYSIMARDISKRKKKEENMQKSLLQVQELQQLLAQKQQELTTTKKTLKDKEDELQILKAK